MLDIRRLGPADALIYQALRLEGLERHPEAFGASLADERDRSVDEVADRLQRSAVFGVLQDGDLDGVAGWYRLTGDKMAHRGALWGMYVRPEARGRGLGAALVGAVIDDARGTVEQVHLTVVTGNGAARRLYERLGFVAYGTEPRALRVDGAYFDELMMVCRLD